MRKLALICCLVFFTIFFGQKSRAQESTPAEPAKADQTPAHFYHLEFVIQEMGTDGKPTNSRSYTATVSTDSRDGRNTSIRTGSRIPVPTGPFSSGNDSQALVNTQFQYVDVGVNIDARRAHEIWARTFTRSGCGCHQRSANERCTHPSACDPTEQVAGVSFDSHWQVSRRIHL